VASMVGIVVPYEKGHTNFNRFALVDESALTSRLSDQEKSVFSNYFCSKGKLNVDDVLFLEHGKRGLFDATMRVFEPDGTEAFMCGNGILFVGEYLRHRFRRSTLEINTKSGMKSLEITPNGVRLDSDPVKLRAFEIPMITGDPNRQFLGTITMVGNVPLHFSVVNTGEPHVVILVDKSPGLKGRMLSDIPVKKLGRLIRRDRLFPVGTNVDFVSISKTGTLHVRTYERGVEAETASCGTGSMASAFVAHRLGLVSHSPITVVHSGGTHRVTIDGDRPTLEASPVISRNGVVYFDPSICTDRHESMSMHAAPVIQVQDRSAQTFRARRRLRPQLLTTIGHGR